MSPLAEKALANAISYIGIKEMPAGSNWGHPVQDWLIRVGLHFPAPWCTAFTYSCIDMAAATLQVKNPVLKTGGVLYLWHNSPAERVTDPQPADLMIFDWDLGVPPNKRKGAGHIGFIESISSDGIHTVEGNTDSKGGRTGGMVMRQVRDPKGPKVLGYLRF